VRKGKPLTPIAPNLFGRSAEERFWAKVDKENGPIHPVLGTRCWVWTAALTNAGYGWFTADRKKGPELAHRLSWTFAHGPCELHVCHHCDNPPCVRPEHLFEGNNLDNHIDMARKLRQPVHKLTPEAVREIRAALDRQVTHAELAATHGVSQSAISDIQHGRSWTHVD
jgi:hypothetical protein